MTTDEKKLDSQQVAPPLPDNIGITQSSGLDRLSGCPDNYSVAVTV